MNGAFFIIGKAVWILLRPSSLLLLGLSAGLVLTRTAFVKAGQRITAATTLCLLTIALLPVGDWVSLPLENRFPPPSTFPEHVDGIVVLGGSIDLMLSQARNQPSLNETAERLTTFVALARRYPTARLVFSGGSGLIAGGPLREADVAKTLLDEIGLDTGRVVFEGQSRDTYENAIFSKKALHPRPGETWILVTSAVHMPRAVGAFRHAGWPVLPWPTGFKTTGSTMTASGFDLLGGLRKTEIAAHEWAGLIYYRIRGRSDALFPGP